MSSPPSSRRSLVRALACALSWSLLAIAPAHAQQLRVDGTRNLDFGVLIPGVPTLVPPTDARRAGRVELVGPAGATVQLLFTLPMVMTGPRGATLPLAFGPAAAGWSAMRAVGSLVPFDPRVPFSARLSADGRAAVFLGGAVHPVTTQAAGPYGATVTITIIPTGT